VTPVVVAAPAGVPGDDLVAALRLPAPRATVVLNGSTAFRDPKVAGVLGALAEAVVRERLTVVTGGTDAGIFALFGAAVGPAPSAPLVGVVPRGAVAAEGVALEPHHTHVVLVDGDAWGDETPALLALAGALGRAAPSAAVICGGGTVTRAEAECHRRAGRPLVAVAGSGGVAGELAGSGEAGAAVGGAGLVAAVLAVLGIRPAELGER
jgi:hypothetical protein